MSCQTESGEEFDVILTERRGIDDGASSGTRQRTSGTVVIDVKSKEESSKK
jgi:hypothetical protein